MFDKLKGRVFILLDELGSGIDLIEGVLLVIVIIDDFKLNKDNCIIFIIYYFELKFYVYEYDDIYIVSVVFDEVSLKFLYKIYLGIVGLLYVLKIVDRLGLFK